MNILFGIIRFPLVVFAINLVFDWQGIYYTFLWIDMPMHFLGGASIAAAGVSFLAFLKVRGFVGELPFLIRTLFLMSFVGLAAVSWELWEFSLDYVVQSRTQVDLPDTMIDMFFGLLGGFALSLFRRIR
ncbi:MAG: hypothetical protein HYU04_01435 [Candidatus Wildermuthbacteria bacterium]|nr:hypothetical protein [Candidatus Wildermuthbacteria bacterium]